MNPYVEQIKAMLPVGFAWPRDAEAILSALTEAISEEFYRIHNRSLALIEEMDPRTTTELLPDLERAYGLPNPCTGLLSTLQERRKALVARMVDIGGQSRQFFIALAAVLGHTITITEFVPTTCEDTCEIPIYGHEWRSVWQVNGPESVIEIVEATCESDCETPLRTFIGEGIAIIDSTCISPCTEPLRIWGSNLLRCEFIRLKPAHTLVIFQNI